VSNKELAAIGLALKTYRKNKGLTQAELAGKTGIHRQNVSDIERGVFVGAISTLQKYLQFAGLELDYREKPSEFPQLDELNEVFGED
jgi:transcriptional regulator with XRE-family HTH domain